MYEFIGKTIMITGAGSGVGNAVSQHLYGQGAQVVLADINKKACEELAGTLNPHAGEILCAGVDVTDRASLDAAVALAVRQYGRIDGLAHCAGVLTNAPFEQLAKKEIDWVIDVNLKGTLYTMQSVGRQMLLQGGGKMAIVASKAGKIGTPTLAHYAASKFGVIGLVQTAAMEWGGRGVYVNAICPGEVNTSMLRKSYEKICEVEGITMEEQVRRGEALSLVGRLTPPENLAKIIAFLLSEDSDEIMGQSLNSCGGIIFH